MVMWARFRGFVFGVYGLGDMGTHWGNISVIWLYGDNGN